MPSDLGTKRHPEKARKDRATTQRAAGKRGSQAKVARGLLSLEEMAKSPPPVSTGPEPIGAIRQVRQETPVAERRTAAAPSRPAAIPATPQTVPVLQTRQMPSLGLIRGPAEERKQASQERDTDAEEEVSPTRYRGSRSADPYEGKSEAMILMEMLMDRMKLMLEAAVESFGVPFGFQETTLTKWKRWFLGEASPEQRREQIAELGWQEVARRVLGRVQPQSGGM